MGSGSSIWTPGEKPSDVLAQASTIEQKSKYESDVNVYFQDLLTDFNNRDTEAINTHLETIMGALNKEAQDVLALRFGGSISKHTYVDGLSDVDVLAIITGSDLEKTSPEETLCLFSQRLRDSLPNSEIIQGKLAVTIHFKDGFDIQILPAIQTKRGIKIADREENKWSNVVRPESFANKLTAVNQSNGNGVVPVIKLYKSINSTQSKDDQLRSYHIESLAIEAFKNYTGPKDRKSMMMHFCDFASRAVLKPIEDKTGQSIHVDDYLGASNSFQRQKISLSIKRLNSRMKIADSEASVEKWRILMGD